MKQREKIIKEFEEEISDFYWKNSEKCDIIIERTIKMTHDIVIQEERKNSINRTRKGICLICNKKDEFSKETICGHCCLKWMEKKGFLKDYIKRKEVCEEMEKRKRQYYDADGKPFHWVIDVDEIKDLIKDLIKK